MSSTLAQGVPPSMFRRVNAAPTVAVSATSDDTLGGGHRVRLNSAYIHALESAGLIPVIVPPLASDDAARAIAERFDGIVLTGGEDVDPSLYGQPRIPECGATNIARDKTETALVRAARELRKPLLAICRGPQMLNVALGGTLYQDIPVQIAGALGHNAKDERSSRVHPVRIETGSRIAEAMGATDISVNSLHHQSVRGVAPGLVATAHSPDGVIEGVESSDSDWWVIAVQWHPEEMNDAREDWDRGLFKAFAEQLAGQ
ncbi:MAG: gamma-glutamyl-gamma-aminobutyrate hydrolase family protein [Gemmatimonadaceae bacterium]